MIQRCSRVVLSVLLLAVAGHAQSNISTSPLTDAGKPSLKVYATVSMKDGSTATLDPSTVSVSIDKQSAQVTSVRSAKDDKLLFTVIVDISSSQTPKAQIIKDAAVRIFEELATGENEGYLVLVNQVVMPSKRALQSSEVQIALDRIKFGGGTALYDAIEQTCTQILNGPKNPDTHRKVLIILSDGDDSFSHTTAVQAEESAQREGVSLFSIAEFSDAPRGETMLKMLSRDTGGKEIYVNKLPDGVTPLLVAIQEQWILSVVPVQGADTKLHSLVAKPSQKDILVSVPAHILIY